MKERVGFALLELVVGLAVGVVLIVGFTLWKNSSTPPLQDSIYPRPPFGTTSPTIEAPQGWKKYQVTTLNYEFAYPPTWEVKESKSQGYPYIKILDPVSQSLPAERTDFGEGALIQVFTENRAPHHSQKALSDILPLTGKGLAAEKYSQKAFNGIEGLRYSFTSERGGQKELYMQGVGFFKKRDNETLVFDIQILFPDSPQINQSQKTEYLETFNRLISSFRFLENPSSEIPNTQGEPRITVVASKEQNWLGASDGLHVLKMDSYYYQEAQYPEKVSSQIEDAGAKQIEELYLVPSLGFELKTSPELYFDVSPNDKYLVMSYPQQHDPDNMRVRILKLQDGRYQLRAEFSRRTESAFKNMYPRVDMVDNTQALILLSDCYACEPKETEYIYLNLDNY